MNRPQLTTMLDAIRRGELSVEDGLARLRGLPFEDIGFAVVDHHRPLLSGAGEVIYASGKTADEVVAIAERIAAESQDVLVTRCAPELAARLTAAVPGFTYHARSRLAVRRPTPRPPWLEGTVLVIAAG